MDERAALGVRASGRGIPEGAAEVDGPEPGAMVVISDEGKCKGRNIKRTRPRRRRRRYPIPCRSTGRYVSNLDTRPFICTPS